MRTKEDPLGSWRGGQNRPATPVHALPFGTWVCPPSQLLLRATALPLGNWAAGRLGSAGLASRLLPPLPVNLAPGVPVTGTCAPVLGTRWPLSWPAPRNRAPAGDREVPSVPQVVLIQSGGVVDEIASEGSGQGHTPAWLCWAPGAGLWCL